MHWVIVRLGMSTLLVALLGCVPEGDPLPSMDAGGTVTYTRDVQPILLAMCSPCHADQNQGHHNLATNYADAHKNVGSLDSVDCWKDVGMTMPKTVGECALISATNGRMPMAIGCDQMPQPRPAACVSPIQREVIAAWVAAGMPQ